MKVLLQKIFVIAFCQCLWTGCFSARVLSVSDVEDVGPKIKTRWRYNVSLRQNQWDGNISNYSTKWGIKFSSVRSTFTKELKSCQPDVFSEDGIPVTLCRRKESSYESVFPPNNDLGALIVLLTLPISVGYDNWEEITKCEVEIGTHKAYYKQYTSSNWMGSFSPIALLFYWTSDSWKDVSAGREFTSFGKLAAGIQINGENNPFKLLADDSSGHRFNGNAFDNVQIQATAYAMAVKLKEMEDSGAINEQVIKNIYVAKESEEDRLLDSNLENKEILRRITFRKQWAQFPKNITARMNTNGIAIRQSPPKQRNVEFTARHKIINIGADYAWEIHIDVIDNAGLNQLDVDKFLRDHFREKILADYKSSNEDEDNISVLFPYWEVFGTGVIEARAVVSPNVALVSGSYDSNTRIGKVVVRFGKGRYEEARAWARKNIEILARDKNILLTTGEIPPDAQFRMYGHEKVEGNELEMEFKTE